jgi:hypothetical protein
MPEASQEKTRADGAVPLPNGRPQRLSPQYEHSRARISNTGYPSTDTTSLDSKPSTAAGCWLLAVSRLPLYLPQYSTAHFRLLQISHAMHAEHNTET